MRVNRLNSTSIIRSSDTRSFSTSLASMVCLTCSVLTTRASKAATSPFRLRPPCPSRFQGRLSESLHCRVDKTLISGGYWLISDGKTRPRGGLQQDVQVGDGGPPPWLVAAPDKVKDRDRSRLLRIPTRGRRQDKTCAKTQNSAGLMTSNALIQIESFNRLYRYIVSMN
jgi:hypothetical protein